MTTEWEPDYPEDYDCPQEEKGVVPFVVLVFALAMLALCAYGINRYLQPPVLVVPGPKTPIVYVQSPDGTPNARQLLEAARQYGCGRLTIDYAANRISGACGAR